MIHRAPLRAPLRALFLRPPRPIPSFLLQSMIRISLFGMFTSAICLLPAIKRLPNAVRGIQLHAKSPSTCTCEACIMGKMFRKPFQPSEDKTKTRLLELIHSDAIGPTQPLMMRSYRYIIMFTDDHSRYTEVYFIRAKSEGPAKFKEYVATVEKQHPKSKVCQIRVDGGGEYASREKFLEYLAEEGITREVSAPNSLQQNGISEKCNRT